MFPDGHRREMGSCTNKGPRKRSSRPPSRDGTVSEHPWPIGTLQAPFGASVVGDGSRISISLSSRVLAPSQRRAPARIAQVEMSSCHAGFFISQLTPENHAVQPLLDRDSDRKRAEKGVAQRCGRCSLLTTADAGSTTAYRLPKLQEHIHLPTSNWA